MPPPPRDSKQAEKRFARKYAQYNEEVTSYFQAFASPLIDTATSPEAAESFVQLAVQIWNASLEPGPNALERVRDGLVNAAAKESPAETVAIMNLVDLMSRRKREEFEAIHAYIQNAEFSHTDDDSYTLKLTAMPLAVIQRLAQMKADEQARPAPGTPPGEPQTA